LTVSDAVPAASGSPGPGTSAAPGEYGRERTALAVGGSGHGEHADHTEGGNQQQDATSQW
jgi:hypothetical protein